MRVSASERVRGARFPGLSKGVPDSLQRARARRAPPLSRLGQSWDSCELDAAALRSRVVMLRSRCDDRRGLGSERSRPYPGSFPGFSGAGPSKIALQRAAESHPGLTYRPLPP